MTEILPVNPYGVQKATTSDLPLLAQFACLLLSEEALQPISIPKVEAMVERCVHGAGVAGMIIGDDQQIEASIGLETDQLPYSDENHLAVRWLGTALHARKRNHGAVLLRFAAWAQQAISEAAGRPVPILAEMATLNGLSGKFHLWARNANQVGAVFSFGLAPAAGFVQREVGHDPLAERMKAAKAARV